MSTVSLILFVLCCLPAVAGQYSYGDTGFSYASYYESHMVLQQAPLRTSIWGYAPMADIGSKVTVNITAPLMRAVSVSTTVKAGADPSRAVWRAVFPPIVTTKSCTVTSGLKNYVPIVLRDVLFGDVWVCSGQSNMKFTISQIFNASRVADEAQKYANAIRFFSVGQVEAQEPQVDVQKIEIHWSVPDRKTVWPFSAVCWLYAKNIYDKRGIAMGLVESSWGGTNIEAWSSPECLRVCHLDKPQHQHGNETKMVESQRLKLELDDKIETGMDRPAYRFAPDTPSPENTANSVLWNAMINPLLNMTVYGVIWYQGEANTFYHRDLYNCTFPAMIHDWRMKWYLGTQALTYVTFPFGFVQIGPTDGKPVVAGYADVRWHQTADVGFAPNDILQNVFMAVTVDLTDRDVHFRDKETAALRLALSGLAVAYHFEGLRYQGPWVTSIYMNYDKHIMRLVYDEEKHSIRVTNTTDGFEICCKAVGCAMDGVADWSPAAVMPAASGATYVTLNASRCADLKTARALRYAWRETPFGYLAAAVYSVANRLPAPPFVSFRPQRAANEWQRAELDSEGRGRRLRSWTPL